MLLTETAHGICIGLTDGDAGLPQDDQAFWVGVRTDPMEEELYFTSFRA